jgi:1-acyl-sn-glycerol-3-phosphate acyltransferase
MIRSILFALHYWFFSIFYVLLAVPVSFLPGQKPLRGWVRLYVLTMRFGMEHIAGIRMEARGKGNLPDGPFILAAKHQSWGDGYFAYSEVAGLTFVTGDHLEKFPFMERVLGKLGAIVVDNCGGHEARKDLANDFAMAREVGRSVLIYPEGHLTKVRTRERYRSGVWHMQKASGWPVVPAATNLGMRWAQEAFRKTPGPAVLEFLEPIPAGMDKDAFLELLEERIETATEKLVIEGEAWDGAYGRVIPAVEAPSSAP